MDSNKIKHFFENGWFYKLAPFIEGPEFDSIIEYLKKDKLDGYQVLPDDVDCFNAFKYCPYANTKIVILGMDPYAGLMYNKPIADGLAFSYTPKNENDMYIPPSLRKILKEVEADVYDNTSPEFINILDTNLKKWAEQGVLLLNAALTVREGFPGSHLKIWKPFISYLINLLNEYNPGLIYMLWGNDALEYKSQISNLNHILTAGHPSPLNTTNPFSGCKHFSQANEIIRRNNGKEHIIIW